MVGTRNSIATPDPEAELEADVAASPEHKRRIEKAKKNLAIDALPALSIKEKVIQRNDTAATYTYRGSVYAVTDDTPREWIDAASSRAKKRRSTGTDAENKTRQLSIKAEAESTTQPKTGRKRARTPENETEEDAQQPATKRPRRNSQHYTHDYSRPKDISDFTPGKRKARRQPLPAPVDRMFNSRMRDYARVGGHETMSCIEHARRRAAMQGFNVEPLSPSILLPKKGRTSRTSGPRAVRDSVGLSLMRLAKLNTRIDKVGCELRLAKDFLRQLDSYRTEVDHPTVSASLLARAAVSAATTTQEPPPPSQTSDTPELQANSSHVNDPEASPPSISRHDSGASIVPDDVDHPSTTTTLPSKNKAGQNLRWSLPEQLKNDEYAERAINRARMSGESKSARRRRIRRELKLVKSWAAKTVDGMQEEDTEEEQEDGKQVDEEIQVCTPTPEDESCTTESVERRSSRVSKSKNITCRDWMTGDCWRGNRCTYMHE